MKAILTSVLLLATALTLAANYTTQSWDVFVVVSRDRSLKITEDISVTFTVPQHGLIRRIPTDGHQYELISSDAEVPHGIGLSDAPTHVSDSNGEWVLKIGNPNRTISGPARYRFTYVVRDGLQDFPIQGKNPEHTELNWNVIPTGWATSIGKASFSVKTPVPGTGSYVARILAGPSGSRWGLQLALDKPPVGDSKLIEARLKPGVLHAVLTRSLPLSYGMTVVLSMPKGTVDPPAPRSSEPEYDGSFTDAPPVPTVPPTPAQNALGFSLPLLALVFIGWWTRRNAPKLGPVVVQFEPPEGIQAAYAGLLIDGDVDRRDIVAGILQVAQKRGFVLNKVKRQISIHVLDFPSGLTDFETHLYNSLAVYGPDITTDALKGNYSASYSELRQLLRSDSIAGGLMKRSSKATTGFLYFGALIVLAGYATNLSVGAAILGFAVALLGGILFIALMPYWTPAGAQIRQKLLGLKEFIVRAQDKELQYMTKIEPTQALFEKLLPFAVAFGAVNEWSRAFSGIELTPPNWYAGYDTTDALWTNLLVSDVSNMTHSWGSAMSYVQPSVGTSGVSGDWGGGGGWSSGGGFSDGGSVGGGGGGGGGGDSW